MSIWKKHLFKEATKNIFFILLSLFTLYAIIDFSTISVRFFKNTDPSIFGLIWYYFHQFIRYLDIFLPLSLMLAIIRVLSDMQIHQEITPLLTAGISRKKVLMPFFVIALLFSCISFANFQFLVPKSLDSIESFRKEHGKKAKEMTKENIGIVTMKDGSTLVYQKQENQMLYDVFWILSHDDIWYMKSLFLSNPSVGYFVDHLVKSDHRLFEKKESFAEHTFTTMKKPHIDKKKTFIPYENRSITTLFSQILKKRFSSNEERANILTHLHLKLAMPWLSCILVIALPPYLLNFTRRPKTFFISIISLALFVAFFTLIDSAAILGENQVISPSFAIWFPFLTAATYFLKRFTHFD